MSICLLCLSKKSDIALVNITTDSWTTSARSFRQVAQALYRYYSTGVLALQGTN